MTVMLFSLLALLPAALAASASVGVSSPLLLWSNKAFVGKGSGQHVSYQVVPDAECVTAELVLGAVGKATDAVLMGTLLNMDALEAGAMAVVFLGSQLDASDLRRGSAATKLGGLLDAAESSLVLPYASSKFVLSQQALAAKLSKAGLAVQVVGCSIAEESFADAVSAAQEAGVQVLLACSRIPESEDTTSAGLEAELVQLTELQQAVQEAGVAHVFVYTSSPRPGKQAPADGKRRSLLQYTTAPVFTGFGPYTTCGPLCQTQVRWLEGMLAVLFMAIASCAGLSCLYVLDTPTRFETPKEAM